MALSWGLCGRGPVVAGPGSSPGLRLSHVQCLAGAGTAGAPQAFQLLFTQSLHMLASRWLDFLHEPEGPQEKPAEAE